MPDKPEEQASSGKDWGKVSEQALADEDPNENTEAEIEPEEPLGLEHPSYAGLEDRLTAAEQQAQKNYDMALRIQAEFDNYKARSERDISNAHKYGKDKILTDLLAVVDSHEQSLAIEALQTEAMAQVRDGIELTLKIFLDVLSKHGVTQIDPQGEVFDPQLHEAMTMQEVPDVKSGMIITVLQKGYRLHDRLVRPARVIVAK